MQAAIASAIALVQRAGVAIWCTGRPACLLGVSRTGGAGAGAGLGRVALVHRRTADRAAIACWMLAARTRAIALIQGADVAIVRTGRTRRCWLRMLAASAGAIALIQSAGVAIVRTGRPSRCWLRMQAGAAAVALIQGAVVAIA